jgi:hypothetical protein
MKHNRNHDNARSTGLQLQPVRFEFTHVLLVIALVMVLANFISRRKLT